MIDFPTSPVTVTMTGEEWFALLLQLTMGPQALSPSGRVTYNSAARKLADQLGDASDMHKGGFRPRPRLVGEGGQ